MYPFIGITVRCAAALWLASSIAVPALSAVITVDPDAFPAGTVLNTAFSGVTLSVIGEPDTKVISSDGFSDFLGRNVATTGTRVFGQDPALGPLAGRPVWDQDNHGMLRADFLSAADFVNIDLIFDDDDVGILQAFNSSGVLLESIIASGDGRTADAVFTATITRPTPDIAFVIAGGVDAEGHYLDNLKVRTANVPSPVPEPGMLAFMLMGLVSIQLHGRRRRNELGG